MASPAKHIKMRTYSNKGPSNKQVQYFIPLIRLLDGHTNKKAST